MDLVQAVEILKDYVKLDRSVRADTENKPSSDFENFCEEKCVAIETILSEVATCRCKI